MYNTNKKNYTTLDAVFDSFFNDAVFPLPAVKYQNSRLSIDVTEEEAIIALSVLGHSKDDITIELEEDAIFVKSVERELSKVEKELISTINDRIAVGDKFDGEKSPEEFPKVRGTCLAEIEDNQKQPQLEKTQNCL